MGDRAVSRTALLVSHTNTRQVADLLRASFPWLRLDDVATEEEAAPYRVDAEILITMGVGLTPAHIDEMPRLRWVQAMVGGTDHFAAAIAGRDLLVTTSKGVHGPQIAEMVVTHMLVLNRNVKGYVEDQARARWDYTRGGNAELLVGKTVAIVGLGGIGRALAPLCRALGMSVIGVSNSARDVPGVDRYHPRDELKTAVSSADFVVLALPHNEETHNLIDADALSAFKRSGYLINVARGGLVDEVALIDALRSGAIAGAGLDVVAREPLPEESPLWGLPNVFITPHVAGSCGIYPRQIAPLIEKNLNLYIAGDFDQMINRLSSPA
jgi:D-2-hydroxyacid dehydrogenase (NADP+)